MFFRFPPDARWNPERSLVEFGIGVGEYEGVVRISRRVFQILVPETLTPERCLEGYYIHRPRFELIAERKVRRRQLNRRWERRDHRSRSSGTGSPGASSTSHRLSPGRFMRAAQQAAHDAERRFTVRIRLVVPPLAIQSISQEGPMKPVKSTMIAASAAAVRS